MTKLHLAAALLAVAIAGPVAAQNVQDKNAPQNPKDVTPASPSGQGATGDAARRPVHRRQGMALRQGAAAPGLSVHRALRLTLLLA